MNTHGILTVIDLASQDEADTPEQARDRVKVRALKVLIREHIDRAEWNERMATDLESELAKTLAKHGWVDDVSVEDEHA